MVRTYRRKTNRADINEDDMKAAIMDVIKNKKTIRVAADDHNIKHATFQHRIEKYKKTHPTRNSELTDLDSAVEIEEELRDDTRYQSKYTSRQVFTDDQEQMLMKYLLDSSKIHYGLTYHQARILAFEYATQIPQCRIPPNWVEKKIAGLFWMQSFIKRHPNLSLRKPENTSLARATAFNRHTVDEFFNNYSAVLEKYHFTPDRIFNIDETGITTVLSTPKVISEKGKKQVGQIVSGERGQLVTFCGIINASGAAVPPAFVFPRVRYKDHFLNGSPVGSLGLCSKSGWMTGEIFMSVIKHLQNFTNCSREKPILVLLDNHESHCTVEIIEFCREHGITLLSFPPHTSHKFQPLDVAVYSSFKANLKTAFNDWLLANPGKQISIYNIPALANTAYINAFTPRNILKAFAKPGIWPLNRMAFSDDNYLSSYVTDREIVTKENHESLSEVASNKSDNPENEAQVISTSSLSANNLTPSTSRSLNDVITPEQIRPFPKAEERKKVNRERQGKSRIYTTTPEKNRIEGIAKERQEKKLKQVTKKLKLDISAKTKSPISSDDSESVSEMSLSDSIDDISEEEFPVLSDEDELVVGDYVIVKFATKRQIRHFVGQILNILQGEIEIKFLRRHTPGANKFIFPNVEDISLVTRGDITYKLPKPLTNRGTSRQSSFLYFSTIPLVIIE